MKPISRFQWKQDLQTNNAVLRDEFDESLKAHKNYLTSFQSATEKLFQQFDDRLLKVEKLIGMAAENGAFGLPVADEKGDQKQTPRRLMPALLAESIEESIRRRQDPGEKVLTEMVGIDNRGISEDVLNEQVRIDANGFSPPRTPQRTISKAVPSIHRGDADEAGIGVVHLEDVASNDMGPKESGGTDRPMAVAESINTEVGIRKFRVSEAEGVQMKAFSYGKEDYKRAKESWQTRHAMYEFEHSAWDVGIFPFVRMMSVGSSVNVMVVFVFNFLLQLTFTCIILAYFCQPEIDQEMIDDLKFWRVSVAHDLRWMDTVTQQSLARKVCNKGGESGGLYMSGAVQTAVQQVLNYIPTDRYREDEESEEMNTLSAFFFSIIFAIRAEWIGMILCLMCLVVWWLTCILELKTWLDSVEGIWNLPSAEHTKIILVEGTDDIAINQFSRTRKMWCGVVFFLRIAVCGLLGYAGSMYLVTTLSLRDMILNAVSLELVLGLDELMYAAMIPFHVRHFMSSLEPIPKSSAARCLCKQIDWETTVIFTVLVGLTTVFTTYLHNGRVLLRDALEAMCGGYLDFVYTMDPGGAVVAHATRIGVGAVPELCDGCNSAGFVQEHDTNYAWKAVEEVIYNPISIKNNPENSMTDGAASLSGSRLGLQERSSIPLGVRMAELNPKCADLNFITKPMVWPPDFIGEIIQGFLTQVGIVLTDASYNGDPCKDLRIVPLCNADNETGISLRQWCPHTCGCDSPSSGLILSKSTMGCPNSCFEGHNEYFAELHASTCVDRPVASVEFQRYLQGLKDVQASYRQTNIDWYNLFQSWIDSLSQLGCAGHKLREPFGDLCSATAFKLKPLQYVCPVSCGCPNVTIPPNDQAELCPVSCVNYTTSHRHHPNPLVFATNAEG